jgi:hypothetical protein
VLFAGDARREPVGHQRAIKWPRLKWSVLLANFIVQSLPVVLTPLLRKRVPVRRMPVAGSRFRLVPHCNFSWYVFNVFQSSNPFPWSQLHSKPLDPLAWGLNVSVCVAVCVHYGALQRRKTLETGQTSDMRGEEAPSSVRGFKLGWGRTCGSSTGPPLLKGWMHLMHGGVESEKITISNDELIPTLLKSLGLQRRSATVLGSTQPETLN